ncbi:type II toxin-antitoxin system VapB family antitoxin [Roseomonas hellenica]|uniref:Type II toxin-antitoxin system VapB family antitoxin n=2 Tax=Plastoroseomonas hellenica TaxID=2687306 RepID=A0ABS5F0Y7_9PROT|nr:type II toxin-antitoxin system VapB family antitoxin [Plastoroseomonas hellenica]MBR0666212.1 type II toxin-antitoxin system VapB family antitoxin [Plastoroseomonas hellenica]
MRGELAIPPPFYHIWRSLYQGHAMGQLNIKDDALIAEAKELAALLGTSTTAALREAVHERLLREKAGRESERKRRYDAIMAIAERSWKLFPPGTSSDHSDLYDENGLPK